MMVFIISRVKQVFGKFIEVWNKIWKVLGSVEKLVMES